MASKESPIRAARRRLGLSRDELGRILNVSGRTVSYWETRRKLPDPDRASALRATLGLSEIDLWRALHKPAQKVATPERRERPW
jgi:DNA-binding transcriptional regulator YiaG